MLKFMAMMPMILFLSVLSLEVPKSNLVSNARHKLGCSFVLLVQGGGRGALLPSEFLSFLVLQYQLTCIPLHSCPPEIQDSFLCLSKIGLLLVGCCGKLHEARSSGQPLWPPGARKNTLCICLVKMPWHFLALKSGTGETFGG